MRCHAHPLVRHGETEGDVARSMVTHPATRAELSTERLSARRLAKALGAAMPRDARYFQITALGTFLAFGILYRAFDITGAGIAAIFLSALATQGFCSRLAGRGLDVKSALITSLSLTLLLRTDGPAILAVAAAIAIASKFLIRIRGRHVFNPANAGIVSALLFSQFFAPGLAWTTPGQWGAGTILALGMAGLGLIVTNRAARLDAPLIFLGAFGGLMIARALWLGDPLAIPMLRLQNGALILFAFFMISDPKTTPDGAIARALFCAITALIAFMLNFNFHMSDGIFYALAIACLIRPLIDLFDRAPRHEWTPAPPIPTRAIAPAE